MLIDNTSFDIVQFPEVSYKSTATPQIYWTDQQGLQLDITKLHRFLKRTDRVEQFYQVSSFYNMVSSDLLQEIQRISGNAIAFGYHGFASEFANVLDKRCKNVPMECKAHLSRVTDLLRFLNKQISIISLAFLGKAASNWFMRRN